MSDPIIERRTGQLLLAVVNMYSPLRHWLCWGFILNPHASRVAPRRMKASCAWVFFRMPFGCPARGENGAFESIVYYGRDSFHSKIIQNGRRILFFATCSMATLPSTSPWPEWRMRSGIMRRMWSGASPRRSNRGWKENRRIDRKSKTQKNHFCNFCWVEHPLRLTFQFHPHRNEHTNRNVVQRLAVIAHKTCWKTKNCMLWYIH